MRRRVGAIPKGARSFRTDSGPAFACAGEKRSEGREVVEMALAHTIKDKAEAANARSDLLEKRRLLMDAWAEQCGRLPAAVVASVSLKEDRMARPAHR